MRDLLFVRWSVLRRSPQGGGRWPPPVREARPGGQAGRTDLLLGRDALSHRPVVQGGDTAPEAGRNGAPRRSAGRGNLCQAQSLRGPGGDKEKRTALGGSANREAGSSLGEALSLFLQEAPRSPL